MNTFPGLVHTARHTTEAGNTRSRWPNPFGREPSKVGLVTGVKSEQGSRTGRCGWITSFLGKLQDFGAVDLVQRRVRVVPVWAGHCRSYVRTVDVVTSDS